MVKKVSILWYVKFIDYCPLKVFLMQTKAIYIQTSVILNVPFPCVNV